MKLMKAYKLTHVAYEFICLKSFSITLLTLLLDLTSGGEFSSAVQLISSCLKMAIRLAFFFNVVLDRPWISTNTFLPEFDESFLKF